MTITITIKTNNAAFGEYPGTEVARILTVLALDLPGTIPVGHVLLDINGKTTGWVKVKGN